MTPTKRNRTAHRVAEVDLPRQAWSVVEVAAQLGRSYDAVLDMLREGELGWVKSGREKLIPAAELQRYLSDVRRGGAA